MSKLIRRSTKKGDMYEVNVIYHVSAKVDAISQKIERLTVTPSATVDAVTPNYEICGVPGYITSECQVMAGIPSDQVNYAQGNPYLNTYNLRWRNHPNFSYKNNNTLFSPSEPPPGFQKAPPAAPQAPKKSNLKIMMENFVTSQTQ